jgi:hypothetical protein
MDGRLTYSTSRATAGLAAAALLAVHASTTAQTAPSNVAPEAATPPQSQTESSQVTDEVIVRGRRMSEIEFDLNDYVTEFIREIAAPPAGQGFARWHRDVCVGVHNLERSAAQYIVDRVSLLAAEVGLAPGEPGCRPDVIIIFTLDGDNVASYMVENQMRTFQPGMGLGGMARSDETLQEFTQSDSPVRWWHVSFPVDARTGQRAVRMQQDENPPAVSVAGPSRIHNGISDNLSHVIIIVDATKLVGTTWEQLGDYLAVVSLAQIDPEADLSDFDSILNLFDNPRAYAGLTDWDRSYVRALYRFNQELRPELQVGELANEITRQELEGE